MTSELEEPAEAAHHLVKQGAHHRAERQRSHTTDWIPLSTMLMALISALGALFAGITANQTLVERTEEITEMSRLESALLHIEVLRSRHEILASLGDSANQANLEKIREYEDQAESLRPRVEREEASAETTILQHELFAIGVTLLSIAITLTGISLVARRRAVWGVGLVFGMAGTTFVGLGFFRMLFAGG